MKSYLFEKTPQNDPYHFCGVENHWFNQVLATSRTPGATALRFRRGRFWCSRTGLRRCRMTGFRRCGMTGLRCCGMAGLRCSGMTGFRRTVVTGLRRYRRGGFAMVVRRSSVMVRCGSTMIPRMSVTSVIMGSNCQMPVVAGGSCQRHGNRENGELFHTPHVYHVWLMRVKQNV